MFGKLLLLLLMIEFKIVMSSFEINEHTMSNDTYMIRHKN